MGTKRQMKFPKLDDDLCDLLFRGLFCSIFLGLGLEHVFSDELIQKLMPLWVPYKRLVSFSCGVILLSGGTLIFLGYRVRLGAGILALFLLAITIPVHGVGVLVFPPELPPETKWLWDILQRTNLVKNICLLGVCFRLLYYTPGKYSLEHYLKK